MPAIAPPATTFRLAREEELESIATPHANTIDDDPISKILFVHSFANRKSNWIKGAKEELEKGHFTIWVLECTETGEIIGEGWVDKYDVVSRPMAPTDAVPEGHKREEYAKVLAKLFELSEELMNKYGKFMYLRELAIAPRYQQQELDERLLVHIMELAGKEKLNLALTANVDKPPLYAKFGFREIGDLIMLGPDNTIEGGTNMLVELFPPGIQASD